MSQINPGLTAQLETACEDLRAELQRSNLPQNVVGEAGYASLVLETYAAYFLADADYFEFDYDADQMTSFGRQAAWACINVLTMLLSWLNSYSESAAWTVTTTLTAIRAALVLAMAGGYGSGLPSTFNDEDDWYAGEIVEVGGEKGVAVLCKRAA